MGMTQKKMENTIVYGLGFRVGAILGIMKKKMETTIWYIGVLLGVYSSRILSISDSSRSLDSLSPNIPNTTKASILVAKPYAQTLKSESCTLNPTP